MIEEIKRQLDLIEIEKEIKILYAVESGSRAWGFASTNSDWDVRIMYIHKADWYLSIEEKKDNFEVMLPNDLDIAGWDLRKALKLFKKSNPPLLEWLLSPIVYKEEKDFTTNLKKLSTIYFNPKSCLYHYFHMAKGNWEVYFKTDTARIKKYFYVLRPLFACCWIKEKNTMPPMEFDLLLANMQLPDDTLAAINKLLQRKMEGEELDVDKRIAVIDTLIEKIIEEIQTFIKTFHYKNEPSNMELDLLFRNTLNTTW